MTSLSPIESTGRLVQTLQKGNTYGQAFKSSSCHSFLFSARDGRYYNQNGTKVFSRQAYIFPLQPGCIISR